MVTLDRQSGYIVRMDDGTHLYVFSSVGREGFYPDHIGINLTTGTVDEFKQSRPLLTTSIEELSGDEKLMLSTIIPVLEALKKGTIAITAKARSGKDRMADYIHSNYPTTSRIKALAEPIREIDLVINGKVHGKNRASLIMIGQGLREQDPNIWIKTWLRRCVNTYLNSNGTIRRFICQDLRQPNEYQFFKNLGAVIVRIEVDEEKRLAKIAELDGKKDAINVKLLNDETEQHTNNFKVDYTIKNEYTLHFEEGIRQLVSDVLIDKKGW